MFRLYRRIRYGDTSTPKYITKQHRWLYKNKWVGIDAVCEHFYENKPMYTYEYTDKGIKGYDCVNSIDELISAVIEHDHIKFTDITQFSKQELEMIVSIQKTYYDRALNKYLDKLADFNETIENFRF